MANYLISVIIPVHNGSNTLGRCLEGVFKSSYPNFECIVVDDHSIDNTVEIANTFRTRILRLDNQKGSAYARNQGAQSAQGDILLFIDSDVEVYLDTLDKVIRVFEDYPEVSALFGSYDDHPGSPNFISQYKNLFHHYIHQTSKEDAYTFWSGCGAIKKDVFDKVRGFDQEIYSAPCIEDIEMGSRLKKMGYRILLAKHLQVKHLKHYSFFSLLKSDIFDRAIPWTVVMLKNKKITSDLNLKIEHRLSAAIVILVIFSALMSIKSIWIASTIPILLGIFFFLNRDFYRFFLDKRGCLFTLKIIPLHFLYYLYSAFGFFWGICEYIYQKHLFKIKNPLES